MKIFYWLANHCRQFFRKSSNKGTDRSDFTREWINSLEYVSYNLKTLSFSTEHEFLDIGEKLQGFHNRAQNMSEMSSAVVDLMTGDEIYDSTKGLAEILEELKRHLSTSEEHFTRISNILSQYMNTIRKATSHLDEFKMLVLNLNMLGFFTRVENAHVFTIDTGFASLASNVKKLSKRIDEKTSHIMNVSQALLELINQAISEVEYSEKNQRDQARLILKNTVANHRMLKHKNDSAALSAKLIESRTRDITESIGDIVSSLQIHDITRQQIEHVKEVIDTLIATIISGQEPISKQASTISALGSLQLSQLDQSQKALAAALMKIIDNLQGFTQDVGEILGETQKVSWTSEFDGMGFMEEIDYGIESVSSYLDKNIKEQIRLTGTLTSVSEMVSEMAVFIQEIENMGQNLQLISLNARIKAAHLGEEGAALDTISGGIYDLSKDSLVDTKILAGMLSEIVDIAHGFDTDLKDMQSSQKKQAQTMVHNLHEIIASLHQVNERVLSLITDMNSLGEPLMVDIKTTIKGITVHDKIAKSLCEAQDIMKELMDGTEHLITEEKANETKQYLKEVDSFYTMESEREVHMKHMEQNSIPDTDNYIKDTHDELGENVELF